jgi:RHS repeat-associated protein
MNGLFKKSKIALSVTLASFGLPHVAQANYNYTNSMAKQILDKPIVNSCIPYNDPISFDNTYSVQDIDGPLPYIRNYSTSFSEDVLMLQRTYNPVMSLGGWTNNYESSIIVTDIKSKRGNEARFKMLARLPGEINFTTYTGDLASGGVGNIRRAFGASPFMYSEYYRENALSQYQGYGFLSNNHKDRKLQITQNKTNIGSTNTVQNVENLRFSIFSNGTKYHYEYMFTSNVGAIYKVVYIEYSDKPNIQIEYDRSNGAITLVKDAVGNFLRFTNDQIDNDAYSAPVVFKYPTLIESGKGDSNVPYGSSKIGQTVSYTYRSSPFTNYFKSKRIEQVYTIAQATSTNNGTEGYSYESVQEYPITENQVIYFGSQYEVPALSSVTLNGKNKFRFEYPRDSLTFRTHYKGFSTINDDKFKAKRVPGGRVTDAQKNKWYADYSLEFYTENQASKDYDRTNIVISGAIDGRDVKYDFSGFPCYTYKEIPISNYIFNTAIGQIIQVTDRKGNVTSFDYDDQNRLKEIKEAVGKPEERITTAEYSADELNYPIPIKLTKGWNVTNNILQNGLIRQSNQTFENGTKNTPTSYVYNSNKQIDTVNLADGTSVKYNYESVGGLLNKTTLTKNGQTSTEAINSFNKFGFPLQILDNGITTVNTYNDRNAIINVTERGSDGTSRFKSLGYVSPTNLVWWERDFDLVKTEYAYDYGGVLTKKIVGDIGESYEYDANGNLIKTNKFTNTNGTQTNIQTLLINSYDRWGRLSRKQIGSDSNVQWEQYTYDTNNNLIKKEFPIKNESNQYAAETMVYDALNRMIEFTDRLGNKSYLTYDKADNVTINKAPNNSLSDNMYMNGNELKSETNNDYGQKNYTYDQLGENILTSQHGERNCNYQAYTVLDQISQYNCAGGAEYNVGYKFNYLFNPFGVEGQLKSVESDDGYQYADTAKYNGAKTYYEYDKFNRITNKNQRVGVLQASGVPIKNLNVNYSYTAEDRIKTLTYPSGKVVTYNYDNTNAFVSDITVGNTNIAKLSFKTDLLDTITWGNGRTTKYNYNLSKLYLESIVDPEYSTAYSYNEEGLLISELFQGGGGVNFTYYNDNQLKTESSNIGNIYTINYQYDSNKNRKNSSLLGSRPSYPYKKQEFTYVNNKFSTILIDGNFIPFDYTNTGELNLTNLWGGVVYDKQGRRAWESPTGNYPAGYLQYNQKNERVYNGRGGIERQYIYDEDSKLLGEYDINGLPVVEYVWVGLKPIAALYPNNQVVYILSDYKETPRRGIDAANNQLVWKWDPDAFGVIKPNISNVEMNLRFPGQVYDKATGLFYNLNRYYYPLLGRYLEPDPIGLAGGRNPYVYAENDPVNKIDIQGKAFFLVPIGYAIAGTLMYKSAMDGQPPTAVGAKAAVAGATVLAKGSGVLTNKETISRMATAKANDLLRAEKRAEKLSRESRKSMNFTKAGKEAVKDINRIENNGVMICNNSACQKALVNPKQSQKGVTPPKNEAHVDHIDAKSKGGSGTPDNGQVLCGPCNIAKSDKGR